MFFFSFLKYFGLIISCARRPLFSLTKVLIFSPFFFEIFSFSSYFLLKSRTVLSFSLGKSDLNFRTVAAEPFSLAYFKTCSNQDPRALSHPPQEISRIRKYLIERGAEIEAQLTSTQYRRSQITQGGTEISCKVIVRMPTTVLNRKLLDRYKELVTDLYSEPQTSELMGSFLYDDIVEPSKETCTKKNKKVAQHNTKSVKSRDIRSMFTEVTRKKSTNTHDISSSSIQKTIVID